MGARDLRAALGRYLERVLGRRVDILGVGPLGSDGGDVKSFGYGVPVAARRSSGSAAR